MPAQPRRKRIEVSLPPEAINRESAREKSIRHGHTPPPSPHLWWACKPLATARAGLLAQLVDDPSSRPDEFPTEEDQARERARLRTLIERLVVWENTTDERFLAEAHATVHPPKVLPYSEPMDAWGDHLGIGDGSQRTVGGTW